MPRVSDFSQLRRYLSRLGVPYTEYCECKYICQHALALGAIKTISIRDEVDFAFDSKGRLVGTFTANSGSFRSSDG